MNTRTLSFAAGFVLATLWSGGARAAQIHIQAARGNLKRVKSLLAKKEEDLEAKSSQRQTPLHVAANAGKMEVVAFLIEQGANVDAQDRRGKTPLHLAAFRGRKDVIEALLKAGADPSLTDKSKRTPAKLARSKELRSLLDKAVKSGGGRRLGSSDTSWVRAAKAVHAEFKGKSGAILHVGDSATESKAYFNGFLEGNHKSHRPYRKYVQMLKRGGNVNMRIAGRGWNSGNIRGGVVDKLRRFQPEIVFVLIGSNDVRIQDPDQFERHLRTLLKSCIEWGAIVVLSTIPPRKGGGIRQDVNEKMVKALNEVVRKLAREKGCPVRDLHAQILKFHPDDWANTLLKNGLTLSEQKSEDISDENVKNSGQALLNRLTIEAYADVAKLVLGR